MQQEHPHSELALSLLCTVCDREKAERVSKLLEGHKSYFNLASLGTGTANSKILNYLGLGNAEKVTFFSFMPAAVAAALLETLDGALDLARPGHGIAFISPIHEGCYHKPVTFTYPKGGDFLEQTKNAAYDLIMVVLNRGYTEEVMDEARAAGATGGTVLHARGVGLAGAEKFFGVTIQPEKEVLMILASDSDSCGIMAAIAEKVGPGSDANAISFSVPVSAVRGLSCDVPDDF